jgi:hypothetical protein
LSRAKIHLKLVPYWVECIPMYLLVGQIPGSPYQHYEEVPNRYIKGPLINPIKKTKQWLELGLKRGSNLVPHFLKLAHCSPSCAISIDFLASLTIEFDASPRAAYNKIVGPCTHSSQASTHHTWAEDGYLKRPHPPNIDGDNRWDRWMVYGWTWGWRTCDTCCT